MDILMRNKVSQEAVLRGIDSEDLRNVIFEMASRANSHLEKVCIKFKNNTEYLLTNFGVIGLRIELTRCQQTASGMVLIGQSGDFISLCICLNT